MELSFVDGLEQSPFAQILTLKPYSFHSRRTPAPHALDHDPIQITTDVVAILVAEADTGDDAES